MPNNQIFEVLAIIDRKEMLAFGRYLRKVHSKKVQMHQIYDYLVKFHKDEGSGYADLKIEKVINYLFPKLYREKGQEVDQKLRNDLHDVYSKLKILLEGYLVEKELKNQSFIRNYLLIRSYEKRKATALFVKEIDAAHNTLEKKLTNIRKTNKKNEIAPTSNNGLDLFFFLKKQILHHLKYFHNNDATYVMHKNNQEVQYCQFHLEKYNKLSRIMYQTELINRNKLNRNKNYPINFFIPGNSSSHFQVLELLAQLKFEMVSHQKDEHYNSFKKYLFFHYKKLKKQEVLYSLSSLFNFSMRAIKEGNLSYRKELFDLYYFSISEKLLSIKHDISTIQFLNIINLAAANKQYNWANELIESYRKLDVNSNVIYLAKAEILFDQERYDPALEQLTLIKEFDNISIECRLKSLCLRCYYMLDYPYNFIDRYMSNFGELLRRSSKINDAFKESYRNFIKIFKGIFYKNKPLTELKHTAKNNKNIQCRKWLLFILEREK